MNFKSKNKTKLSYTFLRIVYKLFELEKKERYYGTDQPLHEAEIHMIKCIEENEGIHVTGLADRLGVTKGAVSQIIAKLTQKGMIIKDTDPKNLSRLLISLTDKGKIAYENHERVHEKYEELFNDLLKGESEENRKFLKRFFDSLEKRLDNEEI